MHSINTVQKNNLPHKLAGLPGRKPGLHVVAGITEHASDDAPKRILSLSTHRLQVLFVKYEYLRVLNLCEDKGIREKLKNVFATMCL